MTVLSHSYRIANKFFKSDRRLLFFLVPIHSLNHTNIHTKKNTRATERERKNHQAEKIANLVESLIEIRIDTAFAVDFVSKQLSSRFSPSLALSLSLPLFLSYFNTFLWLLSLGCSLQSDINNFVKFKCQTVQAPHSSTNYKTFPNFHFDDYSNSLLLFEL